MSDSTPQLRASDADRERTAELLRRAGAEGRLTVEELDERLDAAFAARTRAELDELIADVVEAPPPSGSAAVPVRPGQGGKRWLLSIMSGSDRRGHWRMAERCTAVNIMGGATIDLNDVELAAEHVQLNVFSLMGGADIYVPEGLNVEVSEVAFLGGNDVKLGERRSRPGAPTLHIRIVSIMGGTDVKRGRRRRRRRRDEG